MISSTGERNMRYLRNNSCNRKGRNEELEDRLLCIVEKVETEKKQLADEIDRLTRKLECFTGMSTGSIGGKIHDETDEPEDPAMTQDPTPAAMLSLRCSGTEVILGSRNSSGTHREKGYHHFPVLALEEGIIYGFRWQKGNVVKIV
ncbi:hypothetical protein KIN20_035598 [Parelaphostrongylus tenuis]|uniref:Uncharacterized protein n=1 Tax=Parelaphostrongylus tenuis TaxID=148309 RepID=A0AAD5WKZ5_PARTN|nr:hypothetical protein KIN20_035598 [Parelaphostrongylus tenuis]